MQFVLLRLLDPNLCDNVAGNGSNLSINVLGQILMEFRIAEIIYLYNIYV